MAGYGWDEYDVRKGGRETIHDAGNSLDLTIDFVKVPGGQHGGNWAARVKGVPREDALPNQPTTIVFYAGLEGLGSLDVSTESDDPRGFDGDVKLKGYTSELGGFSIDVTTGPKSNEHPEHVHPSYSGAAERSTTSVPWKNPMPPTRFESMDLENSMYSAVLKGDCGESIFMNLSEKESEVLLISLFKVSATEG